jgi:hypothetical protein
MSGEVGDRVPERAFSAGAPSTQESCNSDSWLYNKYCEARNSLVNGAHELYDSAGTGLTSVKEYLQSKSSPTEEGKVDERAVMADAIKRSNPLYNAGVALEYVGKGVKWVGEKMNQGADALDKKVESSGSPLIRNPQTEQSLGIVSGTLGFAGGLVEGVGSIADWSGRMVQGDGKTLKDTGQTLKKVGEGAAYIHGKAVEVAGKQVEGVGAALDSDILKRAGRGVQGMGTAEQSLASDGTRKTLDTAGEAGLHTRKTLDTAGEAGLHYMGKVAQKEGQAIKWVGDKTGSVTLSNAGGQTEIGGNLVSQMTEDNPLVKAVDKAAAERAKEYREHGNYAVSRDTTRAALEVASIFIAPETLIGKSGEGANVTGKLGKGLELVNKTGDMTISARGVSEVTRAAGEVTELTNDAGKVTGLARKADEVVGGAHSATAIRAADEARAAEKVSVNGMEYAKEADGGLARTISSTDGGPAWTERIHNGETTMSRQVPDQAGGATWTETRHDNGPGRTIDIRTREAPDPNGGPRWTERQTGNGRISRDRQIKASDGGPEWTECQDHYGTVSRHREVPDPNGGPSKYEDELVSGPKQTREAATDGGPDWDLKTEDTRTILKRQVSATDGGPPWTEKRTLGGTTSKERAVKAADGGQDWTEIMDKEGHYKRRNAPAADDKGAWTEVIKYDENGAEKMPCRSRRYKEDGSIWTEIESDTLKQKLRGDSTDEIIRKVADKGPPKPLQVETPSGPHTVNIYGNPTRVEKLMLETALNRLPPQARVNARNVYLTKDIGMTTYAEGHTSRMAGFVDHGAIVIDRNELADLTDATNVLYHEMGHVADDGFKLSKEGSWGKGPCVTKYAETKASEDYAETHRVVLADWEHYSTMSRKEWLSDPFADKKMEILRHYGVQIENLSAEEKATHMKYIQELFSTHQGQSGGFPY